VEQFTNDKRNETMNILFMSLSDYKTVYQHGLYSDLLKQFIKHGDHVYLISPFERRNKNEEERIIHETGATIAKVKIWNMQKTNSLEKGVSMLTIDGVFIRAIKKYFSDVRFDLIIYPTPPITLFRTIKYVKRRDGAKTYLLLKDIFPQNAVDIGIMSTTGIKGRVYSYFRKKEKKLYAISDRIGCMSPANVKYVLEHNPEIIPNKVEVCPNTTEPIDMSCTAEERLTLRKRYGIPLNKVVFIYGGNLGKPQDIPFIIECIKSCADIDQAHFLIVGDGTEYGKLEKYVTGERPENLKLMKRLPKEDYDKMAGACDVGLIFLDHRFTIPNFPSRLLSYMEAKLPVLACTDVNSDIGKIITDAGFGWWCESNDAKGFAETVKAIIRKNDYDVADIETKYLNKYFSASAAYEIIKKNG